MRTAERLSHLKGGRKGSSTRRNIFISQQIPHFGPPPHPHPLPRARNEQKRRQQQPDQRRMNGPTEKKSASLEQPMSAGGADEGRGVQSTIAYVGMTRHPPRHPLAAGRRSSPRLLHFSEGKRGYSVLHPDACSLAGSLGCVPPGRGEHYEACSGKWGRGLGADSRLGKNREERQEVF